MADRTENRVLPPPVLHLEIESRDARQQLAPSANVGTQPWHWAVVEYGHDPEPIRLPYSWGDTPFRWLARFRGHCALAYWRHRIAVEERVARRAAETSRG